MEMDSDDSRPLAYHDELNDDESMVRHNYTMTVGLPYPFLAGISENTVDESGEDEESLNQRHSIAIGLSRTESIAEEPKLSQEEFSNYCKSLLKICPKNRILMEKLL